jgi:hypothetical protein
MYTYIHTCIHTHIHIYIYTKVWSVENARKPRVCLRVCMCVFLCVGGYSTKNKKKLTQLHCTQFCLCVCVCVWGGGGGGIKEREILTQIDCNQFCRNLLSPLFQKAPCSTLCMCVHVCVRESEGVGGRAYARARARERKRKRPSRQPKGDTHWYTFLISPPRPQHPPPQLVVVSHKIYYPPHTHVSLTCHARMIMQREFAALHKGVVVVLKYHKHTGLRQSTVCTQTTHGAGKE